MSQPNDSLVDKLQKILALTKSPVEGEASAAVAMLTKLLAKHNLDMADLESSGKAEAPKVGREAFDGGKGKTVRYRLDLAEVLAKHFFCYPMLDYTSGSVVFIGRPENTDSLKMLYAWLLKQIWRISTEEHAKVGSMIHGKRWHAGFGEGIVDRLGERLKAIRDAQTTDVTMNALVVHHDTEISDWMEENYGIRVDGRMTAKDRARAEADAELLATDPEAYYRKYPWQLPLTDEQKAEQDARREASWAEFDKRSEAARKRAETRRQKYGSTQTEWDKYERRQDLRRAQSAGYEAGDRVNLQPFLAGSSDPVTTQKVGAGS